jgi:hypothetical protein
MRTGFWTFSLRRLLVGVTVLCVLAAIMIQFPNQSLWWGLSLATLIPGVGLAFALSRLSRAPRVSLVFGLIGTAFGWPLGPTILSNPPLDWVQQLIVDAEIHLLFSTVGSLLFGGSSALAALVLVKRPRHRSGPRLVLPPDFSQHE